jgi:hypothetical protein
LGRSYLERAASVRRTSGSGCTSVPTPKTPTGGGQPKRLTDGGGIRKLEDVRLLASVPTPMCGSPATDSYNAAGNNDYSRKMVELASITTPSGTDGERGGTMTENMSGSSLTQQASLASVASPSARDWKDASGMSETGVDPDSSIRSRLDQLPRQAQLADSGPTATGGTRGTGSTGQLNPEYSRWLMGLPAEFSSCADSAMLSRRRSRQSLSGVL